MTDHFDDEDILSLVRRAVPAIDDDTVSTTGRQARSVLGRVFGRIHGGLDETEESVGNLGDARSARRKRLRIVIPAGGAAAAAAAGLLVFSLVGSSAPSGGKISLDAKTVAYKTSAALNQAEGSGIAYTQTVSLNPGGTTTTLVDTWSYKGSFRMEVFSTRGAPLTDRSSASDGTTGSGRVVDYTTKSWFTTSGCVAPPISIVGGLRAELPVSAFRIVSGAKVNGHPALELARSIAASDQGGGATGPITGNSGPVGNSDVAGTSGTTGNSGAIGNSGPVGNSGTTGNSGATGPAGHSGTAGGISIGANWVAINCVVKLPTGSSGVTGNSGSGGNSGTTGISGAVGKSGPPPSAIVTRHVARFCAVKAPPNGNSGPTGSNSGTAGNSGNSGASGVGSATVSAGGPGTQPVAVPPGPVGLLCSGSWTVVVNPSNFRPVQISASSPSGGSVRSTISWLTPDATNLALLVAPIPSGFTEVSGPNVSSITKGAQAAISATRAAAAAGPKS